MNMKAKILAIAESSMEHKTYIFRLRKYFESTF